jgi:hypothetical protein
VLLVLPLLLLLTSTKPSGSGVTKASSANVSCGKLGGVSNPVVMAAHQYMLDIRL